MKQFITLLITVSLCVLIGATAVMAQTTNPTAVGSTKGKTLQDAFQKDRSLLESVGDNAGFDTNQREVDPIIANVISVILSFLGVIFLVLMIYGGYTWMTAAGNEQQITKARTIVVAALIGIIITVAAYAITYFVFFRVANRLIE